jgi:hypothetical protein
MTSIVSLANPVQTLSDRFSNLVRDRLTLTQLREVNQLNHQRGPGTCASFSFMEPDALMGEAFCLVTGYLYDYEAPADQSLWNAAWALSKAAGFARRPQLLLQADARLTFVYMIHGGPVHDLRRDKTGQFEVQPAAYYQLTDEEVETLIHANAFLWEDRERKSLLSASHSASAGEWRPVEAMLYEALRHCVDRELEGPADPPVAEALAVYEAQLDAAARVATLQSRNRSASALLVDAVSATGGLVCSGPGAFFPRADSQWLDLSDAYLAACCERHIEPMISVETGDLTPSKATSSTVSSSS